MDLAKELQKIYDSEINIRIGWLWDGGIEVRLGDQMNGFWAEENVRTADEIVPWLQEAIAHFIRIPPMLRHLIRQSASAPRIGYSGRHRLARR